MPNNINKDTKNIRIAKFIAKAGAYSRRDAEKLIFEGKVEINGRTIDSPAIFVSQKDKILADGKIIKLNETTRIWLLNKPKGYITTSKDPQKRKEVFDLLPSKIDHLIPIGRLDLNTEGLLLFTNNGDFSRYMEHPKNKIIRKYKIKVRGKVEKEKIDEINGEMIINNIKYKIINAELMSYSQSNSWLTIEIAEGKNREVRKIFEYLGIQINRLIRIKFGPFELGQIKKGEYIELNKKEVPTKLKKIGFQG